MDLHSLIGRRDEAALLEEALDRVRQGQGGLVLVSGEAGIGKTRLTLEVLESSGLTVRASRGRPDAAAPYGLIASVLRQGLRSIPPVDGPLASQLAMLLPEIGPAPAQTDAELLVEAILEALDRMSAVAPMVILLEDLQWADNATLEVLPPLAERCARSPVLVVATVRADEIGRDHPVRRVRDELRRARCLREISLGPLSREQTGQLLAHVLEAPAAEEFVDLVYERTQGTPLYVEELARSLADGGGLRRTETQIELETGAAIPVPATVRDAIVLRFDAFSETARETAQVAAAVGADFDLELVCRLAGGEEGIGELLQAQVVVETASGASFRHALIRDAVYEEIPWSERRTLHRRIATYLSRAGAPPERVAEHWLAGGEIEPARAALLEVAQRSCRLHAYRDAARAANRALEIWPEGEDEAQRLDSLEQLAHCAQVSGQLGDAARALREALDSPLVVDDVPRQAVLLRNLATALGLQGSWEQALEARAKAARAFEASGHADEAAVEWLALAARRTHASALDAAVDAVRAALELARGVDRTDLVVRARGFEGNLLAMRGDLEGGRRIAQEALSIALASNQPEAAAEAYRRLASVLDYSSDFVGSAQAYATAVDYCRAQGDDLEAYACLGCMSAIVYRTGEWKRALEICREVIEDEHPALGSLAIAHAVTGLIRALRGETKSARKCFQESLQIAHGTRTLELASIFGLAMLEEFDDQPQKAVALHDQVLEGWRETQDRHDLVPTFQWQATFFARHGYESQTTLRADALATMTSGGENPESLAALAHALGEVALVGGDAALAVEHFEQASTQLQALNVPLEVALTTWRLGDALILAGRRAEAVSQLSSAYRVARGLGARAVAALVSASLEAVGEQVEEGRHPDPQARAERAGLTRRQTEIARLLAAGLTNKEIASRLFLSPRTVDMHVSNILDRLDCRTRTEAARRVAELGIL